MKVPKSYKRLIVTELSTNFRKCTKIDTVEVPPLRATELLVRNHFLGINASDINYTSGTYRPGVRPPFPCGFEAIGTVVATGIDCRITPGSVVSTQSFGAFGEYQVVANRSAKVVPAVDDRLLGLEISGVTASLALSQVKVATGMTALVTAAAGATGHFAVQLLKKSQCRVLGTCSSDEKCAFLSTLGVDRPINYKKEDLGAVLSKEFPTGINLVYESVGGSTFRMALQHLSLKGTMITIGGITGYADGSTFLSEPHEGVPIPTLLLQRSATLLGFFLPHFAKQIPEHHRLLCTAVSDGSIVSAVDSTKFEGLCSIADAVEHLHRGSNIGKVIVRLSE